MDVGAATSGTARRGAHCPSKVVVSLLLAGLAMPNLTALRAQQLPAPDTQAPPDTQASSDTQAQGQPPLVDEPGPAPAQAPIAAVWKERRLSFTYNSGSTVYSCRALADRVSSLLRAVGARDDVKVRVSGCSNVPTSNPYANTPASSRRTDPLDPMNPAPDRNRYQGSVANIRQAASVFVTAMLPTEVTDDVSAELEKDKTRRELIARATGNPAARFNDPVLFAARVQQVTLSKKTLGIEPEECELVDQLTSIILPQIDVRTLSRSGTHCTTGSLLAPQLVVEALMPVPYGGSHPLPPLKGEGDAGERDGGNDDDGKHDDAEPPAQ